MNHDPEDRYCRCPSCEAWTDFFAYNSGPGSRRFVLPDGRVQYVTMIDDVAHVKTYDPDGRLVDEAHLTEA